MKHAKGPTWPVDSNPGGSNANHHTTVLQKKRACWACPALEKKVSTNNYVNSDWTALQVYEMYHNAIDFFSLAWSII